MNLVSRLIDTFLVSSLDRSSSFSSIAGLSGWGTFRCGGARSRLYQLLELLPQGLQLALQGTESRLGFAQPAVGPHFFQCVGRLVGRPGVERTDTALESVRLLFHDRGVP